MTDESSSRSVPHMTSWYRDHPGAKAKHNRKWRTAHRDVILPGRRAAYAADPEPAKRRSREASRRRLGFVERTINCGSCQSAFTTYRSLQRYCSQSCGAAFRNASRPHWSRRQKVLQRDGWRCYLCGVDIDRTLVFPDELSATVDHYKPVAAGGTDDLDNLRAAHWRCNKEKADRLPSEIWTAA